MCKISFCAVCRFDGDQVIIVKSGFFFASDDNHDNVGMERYESFCKYKIQTNFHPNEVRSYTTTTIQKQDSLATYDDAFESIVFFYRQTFSVIVIHQLEDGRLFQAC